MAGPEPGRLGKFFHDQTRAALAATQECYILGCEAKPIGAHSVANSRLLRAIADDGHVIYFNPARLGDAGLPELVETGRNKATVFPGVCKEHDEIFAPIDDRAYVPGDKEQEYLFALRASAREFTIRSAMVHQHRALLDELKAGTIDPALGQPQPEGVEFMEQFGVGFGRGLEDLEADREFFKATWDRRRFWKIDTEVVEVGQELPIVASSAFNLELDPNGNQVNDLANASATMRPFYFTLFPQDGKSYALLSWHHSHARAYEGVVGVGKWDEEAKKVAVSNLLTGHVENFAANPTYWRALPPELAAEFERYFGMSMFTPQVPFIYDDRFSLFVPLA